MRPNRREWLKLTASAALGCPFAVAGAALAGGPVRHLAEHWIDAGDKRVRCVLCPRECTVADRERGTCGVRENIDGTYYTLVHSEPCTMANDPIEKKPLFHFKPGCKAFSLATVGCNIECRFCQNWEISQFRPEQVPSRHMTPEQVVSAARERGSGAIAFTYSEPVVFYEYMRDICQAAKNTGLGRVMISNGYIQQAPLRALMPHLDAIKIDLKSFSESFYRDMCSAHLRPVLDTLAAVRAANLWLELVVLIVPTMNDDPKELSAMARWIVQKLGPDVPLHFTRFHPMYKLQNLAPTPVRTLERARQIALDAGVRYAYAGNVPGHPGENTACPKCSQLLIQRDGYFVAQNVLSNGKCPKCSTEIAGVWQ